MESTKSVLGQTPIEPIPIFSHLPLVCITHQMRREHSRNKAPTDGRERMGLGWNPGSTSPLLVSFPFRCHGTRGPGSETREAEHTSLSEEWHSFPEE